jgi:hypothetical protein
MTALPWRMPLVTLLTDFGSSDSYVAEMKGVLLGLCPTAVLVDVTHASPRRHPAGAHLLGRAWHRFPQAQYRGGTGVGMACAALGSRPPPVGLDNGLFTPICRPRLRCDAAHAGGAAPASTAGTSSPAAAWPGRHRSSRSAIRYPRCLPA